MAPPLLAPHWSIDPVAEGLTGRVGELVFICGAEVAGRVEGAGRAGEGTGLIVAPGLPFLTLHTLPQVFDLSLVML